MSGPITPPRALPQVALRWLDAQRLEGIFHIEDPIAPVPVEINRLETQILVRYYEEEYNKVAHRAGS